MENQTVQRLQERFPQAILSVQEFRGETTVRVHPDDLLTVCQFLRDHSELAFTFLTDLCGVDYLPQSPRFAVVYLLYNLPRSEHLRLEVRVDGDPPQVPSVTALWPTANWHEREVHDLFGIDFPGHPNLERILLPDDFVGFPLRKDFPVFGNREPVVVRHKGQLDNFEM